MERLLSRHGLTMDDVNGWAIHPGGRRVLELASQSLGLTDEHLSASYDTLRDAGNCSSATILLVLDRLRTTANTPPGAWTVAITFGPGLTLCAALLRRLEPSPNTAEPSM